MYAKKQRANTNINVEEYAYLVKRIAHHIFARMPSSVMVDDLIQSGMEGLLEAAQNYDDGKGASFETYAGIRIRGAIIDEMRRGDWVPRSVHKNNRAINEAIKTIEARTGRDAKDHEIASELSVSRDEYYAMAKDCSSSRLFSLEESLEEEGGGAYDVLDTHASEPEKDISHAHRMHALVNEIEKLPEREQLVLSLYYTDELNLKEIGAVLGVGESRVSQILSQATARLRSRLNNW